MYIVNNNMLQDWNILFSDILFYGLVWNLWEPLYPETLRIETIWKTPLMKYISLLQLSWIAFSFLIPKPFFRVP